MEKYHREIISHQIAKGGWSYGYVRAVTQDIGEVWIVDAHRNDGHRYVVQARTLMTAFIQLQRVLRMVDGHFSIEV